MADSYYLKKTVNIDNIILDSIIPDSVRNIRVG